MRDDGTVLESVVNQQCGNRPMPFKRVDVNPEQNVMGFEHHRRGLQSSSVILARLVGRHNPDNKLLGFDAEVSLEYELAELSTGFVPSAGSPHLRIDAVGEGFNLLADGLFDDLGRPFAVSQHAIHSSENLAQEKREFAIRTLCID